MTSPHKPTLNLAAAIITFRNLKDSISLIKITPVQKTAAVSITVGVILLGIVARYLRRRKRNPTKPNGFLRPGFRPSALKEFHDQEDSSSRPRSPSIRSIRRQGSVLSGISSASEAGRSDYRKTPSQEPNSSFTPQQLGVMDDDDEILVL